MTSSISTFVFDAYHTLFDVHSAVARHPARIGPTPRPGHVGTVARPLGRVFLDL
jgi:FMN phosphatase YigB (HAD superfamily)